MSGACTPSSVETSVEPEPPLAVTEALVSGRDPTPVDTSAESTSALQTSSPSVDLAVTVCHMSTRAENVGDLSVSRPVAAAAPAPSSTEAGDGATSSPRTQAAPDVADMGPVNPETPLAHPASVQSPVQPPQVPPWQVTPVLDIFDTTCHMPDATTPTGLYVPPLRPPPPKPKTPKKSRENKAPARREIPVLVPRVALGDRPRTVRTSDSPSQVQGSGLPRQPVLVPIMTLYVSRSH